MSCQVSTLESTQTQAFQFIVDFISLQLRLSEIPPKIANVKTVIDYMGLARGYKSNSHVIIYRMLKLMYPGNKPTMGELSRALDLPLSTTTGIIDILVREKYCKRLSDPKDRRVVRVVLTDAGRKNMEIGNEYMGERGREILSNLTPVEQNTFLTLIHKIAEHYK